jgi:mRNA-degrading endonuclease HigB of HigAB toxin-antitoxin module
MKKIIISMLLISSLIYCDDKKIYSEDYKIIENEDGWVQSLKLKDFKHPLKMVTIGGQPWFSDIEKLSNNIWLLHFDGGSAGTFVTVSYYYTYIIDMKSQKIIGLIDRTTKDNFSEEETLEDTPVYSWSLSEDKKSIIYKKNSKYYNTKEIFSIADDNYKKVLTHGGQSYWGIKDE